MSPALAGRFSTTAPPGKPQFSFLIEIKFTEHKINLFFLIKLFIYLFLSALGLRCCVQSFSSCGERGLLSVVVRGLLIAVASLVAEHGL